MKKISIAVILALFFLGVNTYSGFSEETPASNKTVTKTADVNKDGKPDVTYYSDGAYVTKAEADTNFDGKPDVTVYLKDGKFDSAEVDTDYNGTVDKKFTDANGFNKWLNDNHPGFNDELNKKDWTFNALKF